MLIGGVGLFFVMVVVGDDLMLLEVAVLLPLLLVVGLVHRVKKGRMTAMAACCQCCAVG